MSARVLLDAARTLSRTLARLEFPPPVAHVYDPLQYAWAPYETYVTRYARDGTKRVVLLGMNPGPFGMMQTGVPFGEIAAVRDWMGIHGAGAQARARASQAADRGLRLPALGGERPAAVGLGGAALRHAPKHSSATGLCSTTARSCFSKASGRNFTPDKLPAKLLTAVYAACDRHLAAALRRAASASGRSASAPSRRSAFVPCSKASKWTARSRAECASVRSCIRAPPARRRTAAGAKPPSGSSLRWRFRGSGRAGQLQPSSPLRVTPSPGRERG